MKKLYKFGKAVLACLLTVILFTENTSAQFTGETYKERVAVNKPLILGDKSIENQVEIASDGVNIYKTSKQLDVHPSFKIHFTEANQFVNTVEGLSYPALLEMYDKKKSQHLLIHPHHKTELVPQSHYPANLSNLIIAIDPGHYAGNFEEAKREDRYVLMKGSELGLKQDIKIFEADLTYTTAEMLVEKLVASGADRSNILITRPEGKSSVGKNFEQWYKSDFHRQLDSCRRIKLVSDEDYRRLKSPTASQSYVYDKFFKFMDFRMRQEKINSFRPAITIVIHYNAEETNARDQLGYLKPVDENYTVAFVPGAFKQGELVSSEHKIQMLRLLLSTDLENSQRLANFILKSQELNMGIKPLPAINKYQYIKDFCVETEFPGVYTRNLALTRSIRGAVVYLEALYQDNKSEALLLSNKNFEWKGRMVSKRLDEVAESIHTGIRGFLTYNQERYASK